MDSHSQRLARIRRLALAIAALSLLLVLVSAWIRLGAAGLGCTPWPACYGSILEGLGPLQSTGTRLLHRVVATLILVLGFILAWRSRQPSVLEPHSRQAGWLLALMILLTLVGIWSSDPHRAWASFINMIGGIALVAMAWHAAAAFAPTDRSAVTPAPTLVLHLGLGLLMLTVVLGALIGARFAAVACTDYPGCGGSSSLGGFAALKPFALVVAPLPAGDPGGVTLHTLHRWLALASVLVLGIAAWRGTKHAPARRCAGFVLLLLVAQFALGVLTVLGGFERAVATAHSAGAALLVAAAADLLRRLRIRPA